MENQQKEDIIDIPAEKFRPVEKRGGAHDKKFETKPRTYWQDALLRFGKNKGAIAGAFIILFLFLYACFGALLTPYSVAYNDAYFVSNLPRCEWFVKTNFWDGCQAETQDKALFNYYYYMGEETGHYAIKNQKYTQADSMYKVRLDSYHKRGCVYKSIEKEEYELIQKYQNEKGVQVIYPIIAKRDRPDATYAGVDTIANYYYKTQVKFGGLQIVYDENGDIIPVYKSHKIGEVSPDKYHSLRIDGDGENGVEYEYALPVDTGYQVRINYYEYYVFMHTYVLKDGISKPSFLFGTTQYGQDIFTCMASGALFSFAFAITVAAVNLAVGAIYGAVEGYYGGKLDLLMERFSDVLSAIPTVIVISLLRFHLGGAGSMLILFIAFFATGWIGMAAATRMQFYRFKNQEYVLAARTLGAKDGRIIWKHIFPNSLGTLVTKCALIIPSMIYSEVNLSYLGIISLTSGNLTSVGTLLSNGQALLKMGVPHIAAFPSVFLALLLLSFNLFGNGLRDAFNPSLRGAED